MSSPATTRHGPRTVFKFWLERWVQRGILSQLLFVASLVTVVAVTGGLLAWGVTDRFDGLGPAIWWSFLRLTDPGYLGDDEGVALRVISTVVTVLGYVLFMGSLIAILTQWLSTTLRDLESGLTPISMKNHIAILGWTDRTSEVVLQLASARGRLRRFLEERGVRALRVVVQADEVGAARRLEVRDHLGAYRSEVQVFLRTGSSLEIDDLRRIDLARAAAIVLPGADLAVGDGDVADSRTIKALLTLGRMLKDTPIEERPRVVAEIGDPRKVAIAESTMRGNLEIVATEVVTTRLLSQSLRHPRMAEVFTELMTRTGGNSLYARALPGLEGLDFAHCRRRFGAVRLLGVLRNEGGRAVAHLNPPAGFRFEASDLGVFLARAHDQCRLAAVAGGPDAVHASPPPDPEAPKISSGHHRIVIFGWSDQAPAILHELARSESETCDVTLVTRVGIEERMVDVGELAGLGSRVVLNHVDGDYATVGLLDSISFDDVESILFLASGGMATTEEADARTVLGYTLLRSRLEGVPRRPRVLVELLDPASARLFERGEDVMLVTSQIVSYVVSQVCLRPELNGLFDAIFAAGGAEFRLRSAEDYGIAGREVTMAEIEGEAERRAEIPLGFYLAGEASDARLHLNPSPERAHRLGGDDGVVVLSGRSGPV